LTSLKDQIAIIITEVTGMKLSVLKTTL